MPIAKQDFEQFIKQAEVKLIGASEGGLKGEFFDVVSEFLNDSSAWTQDIAVRSTAGVRAYPLFVPEGQILRLAGVCDWGTTQPSPNALNVRPMPVPALMPEVGTLLLANAPSSASNLLVTVVTNIALPKDKTDLPQAPSWLLPLWHVGILDGLLGKMMAQPQKSYTHDKQSAYHLRRFRDAIARARVSKLRANTNGAQAWVFPQTFRTYGQQGGVPSFGGGERQF